MAYDPRKLPFIGSGISNIGQVYDTLSTPCSIEPEIWFLAFWHGVPQLAYTLIKPEPIDYVSERFSRGHGSKRRRRFTKLGDITPRIPTGRGLGWAIFPAFALLERLGWYLLVFDAAAQLAVNWTSTAYEWSGCRNPGNPWTEGKNVDGQGFTPTTGWEALFMTEVESQIFQQAGSLITIPPLYRASFHVSFTTRKNDEFTGDISGVRIVNVTDGSVISTGHVTQKDGGGQTGTAVFRNWWLNNGSKDYRAEVQVAGNGYVWLENIKFGAYGAEDSPLLPDP